MTHGRRIPRFLLQSMAAILLSLPSALQSVSAAEAPASEFRFVAFGDMPYRSEDFSRLDNLIRDVNAFTPAFTIHVGDFKSGGSKCADGAFLTMRDYLNKFDGPLIFRPGDNDWSDCDRRSNGSYDPNERLAFLRNIYFPSHASLGRSPKDLIRQSDFESWSAYVENAMWIHGGVAFATFHMVGWDNNRGDDEAEFRARNAADIAWIQRVFAEAEHQGLAGVTLAFHADPFGLFAPAAAFGDVLAAIGAGATALNRPVLLIHGDGHSYTVDHPLRDSRTREKIGTVTRVEVFGGADMHAVEVVVDRNSPELFRITPLIIKDNL